MSAGGSEVNVMFKVQGALGTPATGTDFVTIKHLSFSEWPGAVTDRGEPEIGGSLHVISDTAIYGYSPEIRGATGKLRIPTAAKTLLNMAGWTDSGAGVYVPPTTNAAFPYYTVGVKYTEEGANDAQVQLSDFRIGNLVFEHQPRQAPRFSYDGLGANHGASTVSGAIPASDIIPSPVAPVVAANSTFFGVAGFKCYGFTFRNGNNIDNSRQPLGQVTPDDVVVTTTGLEFVFVIRATRANMFRGYYGADTNTAISAELATGALNLRQTQAGSGAGLDYIEYAASDCQYTIEEPSPIDPQREVFLTIHARPAPGATTTITFGVTV